VGAEKARYFVMWRRLILIGVIAATVGIFLVLLNPVNSKFYKLALMACLCGVWFGTLFFAWKRKVMRLGLLAIPLLVLVPFLLPGGKMNQEELRKDYLRRMTEFEGTNYFWGGESSRGIDCSGLPRRAYRDALLSYGFRHANGLAFRSYLEQWWFDASAKALGEEYREYTKPLGVGGEIKTMSYARLLPGDFAVTDNGVHVIVYVGGDHWIQADPGVGSVVTLDGRRDENPWFDLPVKVYRWSLLAP